MKTAQDPFLVSPQIVKLSVQTAEAIKERASRIYKTYGNIMLNTQGMTAAGIERKATARALFSKLLYLSGRYTAFFSYVQPSLRPQVNPAGKAYWLRFIHLLRRHPADPIHRYLAL